MKKVCSFCGRSDKDVKLLITGLNGYICEDCVSQAYQIVQSSGIMNGEGSQNESKFKIKKDEEIADDIYNMIVSKLLPERAQKRACALFLFLFTHSISFSCM